MDTRNIKVKQSILKQSIAIRARIEWLAVQAVTTGKNIIEGRIERYELDWNIKSQNIITQAGGAAWSGKDKTTFDPNDDIETYSELSEGVTNIIIMGGNVWKNIVLSNRLRMHSTRAAAPTHSLKQRLKIWVIL